MELHGWMKLHRKLACWEWYKKSEMVHLFIHLLISANFKDSIWQGTEIKRGQLLTGRKSLSFETGISEQSIRTCLKKLESTKEINIKSTNKHSIITICNYDSYNEDAQQTNQQSTSNQPATNQQLTSNQPQRKNDKNDKNDNNEKNDKKVKKEIYIPEFFEFKEYALTNKPNVDLFDLELKYKSWVQNGWKNGNNKEIKNWKSALLNTIPYIKESKKPQNTPQKKKIELSHKASFALTQELKERVYSGELTEQQALDIISKRND